MTVERARLFVALELPEETREALAQWRSGAVAGVAGLRLLTPGLLHVTLCFLGWRAESEIDEIGAACGAVASEPVASLSLGEAVWLPPRRPRVLAVELADRQGALARVQAALSKALQAGGWYAPEARPFRAHVTVARVAKGGSPRVRALSQPPPLTLEGSQVTLYRSRLGPGGARYEPLRTFDLGSAPALSDPTSEAAVAPGDPISVVGRFHAEQARAYEGGGLDPLRELLCDDVVWHVPGGSAIAGEHRGIEAVLAYLDKRRRMTDSTFRVTVHGVAMVGDRVVQLAGGCARRGGLEVTWETVGVFRIADRRIAECWLVPFDLRAFDEIWS